MFFAAAVATFLQTIVGSRLPIMQGASFTFVTPAIALLTSKVKLTVPTWLCQDFVILEIRVYGKSVRCRHRVYLARTDDNDSGT